jgi:WG containing repeat
MNKKVILVLLTSFSNEIFSQKALPMDLPKHGDAVVSKLDNNGIKVLDGLENPIVRATKNDKYGLLDNSKKIILPFEYDFIERGNGTTNINDLVIIHKAGKVGYANSKGIIIEPKYDCAGTTSEWNSEKKDYGAYLNVSKGEKWIPYFYDKSNKEVRLTTYSNQIISSNSIDTLFSVFCILKKKYGKVDRFGKLKIPLIHNEPINFFRGFAIVRAGQSEDGFPLKGVINQQNIFVIPSEYSRIDSEDYFENDMKTISSRFRCEKSEKSTGKSLCSVLDNRGKIIVPSIYSNINKYNMNPGCYWYVEKDGKQGLYDNQGNIIVPCEFDEVGSIFNDKIKVVKQGKEQFIDIPKK